MTGLRHSFNTRFIFTGICARRYAGGVTLDDILAEFSREAQSLYYDGVVDS